jgi:hypothetical protein
MERTDVSDIFEGAISFQMIVVLHGMLKHTMSLLDLQKNSTVFCSCTVDKLLEPIWLGNFHARQQCCQRCTLFPSTM